MYFESSQFYNSGNGPSLKDLVESFSPRQLRAHVSVTSTAGVKGNLDGGGGYGGGIEKVFLWEFFGRPESGGGKRKEKEKIKAKGVRIWDVEYRGFGGVGMGVGEGVGVGEGANDNEGGKGEENVEICQNNETANDKDYSLIIALVVSIVGFALLGRLTS